MNKSWLQSNRISGVLVVAGALILSGCSSSSDSAGGSAAGIREGLPANCSEAAPKIGVALPNLSNPYYVEMKKGVEEAATAAGFEAIISIADDDIAQQQSQIDSFIQSGVCAVYLNAIGGEPGAQFAIALSKAGIPVFAVNVFVDVAAVEAAGGSVIQQLGADQAGGGTLSGEQALKVLGADAKLVAGIVGVPGNLTTQLRDDSFAAALMKNPNAKVMQTVDSQVKPDVAQKVTAEMLLGNPKMNVIFADTGPGVVGALLAIKELKREKTVSLFGFCAAISAVPEISGAYKGCVGQEPKVYGSKTIEQIKLYITGTDVEKTLLVATPVFNQGDSVPANVIG
jgi:ribose transport system substrate-binding protein